MGSLQDHNEPVAWMVTDIAGRRFLFRLEKPVVYEGETLIPLYPAPQPRRRLTDEELGKIINANWGVGVWQMGRAIEDAIWSKT